MPDHGGLRCRPWQWHVVSYVAVFALVSFGTSVSYTRTGGACSRSPPLVESRPLPLQSSPVLSRHGVAGGPSEALHLPSSRQQAAPAARVAAPARYDAKKDIGYSKEAVHPVCKFLATSQENPRDELHWGKHALCLKENITVPITWTRTIGTNCYRCNDSANICQNPPTIIYHQYLNYLHPKAWQGNLLSFQAYLMTQELEHTEMWLWADDVSKLYNNMTKPFFDAFKDKIKLKTFDHDQMVKGTVWQNDPFLGNGTLVRQYMKAAGAYSDVVRLLILWHHGGFWMDNDVILLRDLHPLLSVSYQFIMRWINGHCMLMFKGSRLMHTLMDQARTIPLNHPNFTQDVIKKKCNPVGYLQVSPSEYGYTDVYNSCLFRLLRVHHNNGPPADRMYEFPLGWFDQEWAGCQSWKENVTDARWQWIAKSHLAMHTRYPKRGSSVLPKDGTYLRAHRLIEEFFKFCSHADCVPINGVDLLDYEGIQEAVITKKPPKVLQFKRLLAGWLPA